MILKEIINPLILYPIIAIISYLIGLTIFPCSIVIFFAISIINNYYFHMKNKPVEDYYFYIYKELMVSLIFIIPLYYLINIEKPIIIAVATIGLVDLIIQLFYNLTPRKDGKEIIKLWKPIRSEREFFHPISLIKYTFKGFSCRIYEPSKPNPTRNHFLNHTLMKFKLKPSVIKNQFGKPNTIVFSLYKKLKDNGKDYNKIHNDKTLLKRFSKINKTITKNIINTYMFRKKFLRISFDKNYAIKNQKEIYDFLSKVAKFKYSTP